MKEIWKPIEGYKDYFVSNLGKIKTNNEEIKIYTNTNGYKTAHLNNNGKIKNIGVHRLVAMAFISNPDNKPIVNHIDRNKSNNCVTNLEWVTHKENMEHAVRTGLRNDKTECVNKMQRKIAGDKLKRFCQSKGLTQKDVAEILEISLSSVQAYYLGNRIPNVYVKNKMQERLGIDIFYTFYNFYY